MEHLLDCVLWSDGFHNHNLYLPSQYSSEKASQKAPDLFVLSQYPEFFMFFLIYSPASVLFYIKKMTMQRLQKKETF